MLHLYALVTGHAPASCGYGIDGRALQVVRCQPFHAVVSEHVRRPSASTEAALAHFRVVEKLVGHLPTLPVRFGSSHTDASALCHSVASRRQSLLDTLALVAGRVEFAAKRIQPAPTAAPAHAPAGGSSPLSAMSGHDYLQSRADALRELERRGREEFQTLDRTTSALAELADDTRDIMGRAGCERCFLVANDRRDDFIRAARQIEHIGEVEIAGPWPAFSFVTGGAP